MPTAKRRSSTKPVVSSEELEHASHGAQQEVRRSWDHLSRAAHLVGSALKNPAQRAVKKVQTQAPMWKDKAHQTVQRHPMKTAAVATAVGVAVGLLLRGKSGSSSGPLDKP